MNNLRRWSLAALFLLPLAFSGCELFDPDESIPAYIYIDDITLSTDYGDEGSERDKVTDAWVFVNDQTIGAWELPATIPIETTGPVNIKVRGGIKKNGISASRIQYPFYLAASFDMNLTPSVVDTLQPVLEYEEGIQIDNFTFDNAGIEFLVTENSDTSIQRTTDPNEVLEGGGSGLVIINEDARYFEMRTQENYEFPNNGTPIYLEMDYSCSNTIAVGMYGYRNNGEYLKNLKVVLNPTTDSDDNPSYNKIYINFTDKVAQLNTFDYVEFYIESFLDSDNTSGVVLLDNIKVVRP